jgi:hypothetical protein
MEARLDESALDAAAREALAIDLFRCGRLSRLALGRMLGLDRYETSAFLKRHQLFEDPPHEEIDAEVESTRELLGQAPERKPVSDPPPFASQPASPAGRGQQKPWQRVQPNREALKRPSSG